MPHILTKIVKFLEEKDGITLAEFTEYSKIKNFLLSKLIIDEMIEEGMLCIDESDLEVKYYENRITKYVL